MTLVQCNEKECTEATMVALAHRSKNKHVVPPLLRLHASQAMVTDNGGMAYKNLYTRSDFSPLSKSEFDLK